MHYKKEIFSHGLPQRFDNFDAARSWFHRHYREMTPDKRYEMLTAPGYRETFALDGKNDTAIIDPSYNEIDLIFWELVKSDLRRSFYSQELPKLAGEFIAELLNDILIHRYSVSDNLMRPSLFDCVDAEAERAFFSPQNESNQGGYT